MLKLTSHLGAARPRAYDYTLTTPEARLRKISYNLALAFSLIVYFLCFNWGSLRVHFALDDLGNIDHYYQYSPWRLVLSNLTPWTGDSRPLGGLFYMPIYHFAGLNPVPYQAVLILLILITVYFVYRFAILLGAGRLAAGLVSMVYCYHAGISNLYYNAAFVFDVLCCLFYLAAFVYYLRIRTAGKLLRPAQTCIFLVLFLCALNAKEMAVSLPIMLLVYEWIYNRPTWNRVTIARWLRGPALVALIAGLLDAIDVYGKIAGPQAMIHAESYHPVFTLARLHDFYKLAMRDLFFHWAWTPGWREIGILWAVLAVLAWIRSERPVLRFLFCFLLVVPVPIEFLIGKTQACLVLLLVGGALFAAVVFADLVQWVAGLFPPRRQLIAALMVAGAVFLWVREQRHLRLDVGKAPMTTLGFETWDLIQQLRASTFRPRRGTTLAFLDDPFHSLDMYSLAELWVHDRSVTLHMPCQGPLTEQALAKADYLFTIENRRLIRLK